MHVTIGTPMYGGYCQGSYMTSIMALNDLLTQHGHKMSIKTVYNESLIQRARNTIANKFLEDPSSDILLFIDADIKFNPVEIFNMLTLDKDIIGAVVPLRRINWEFVKIASPRIENPQSILNYVGYGNINFDPTDKLTVKSILENQPFKVERIGGAVLSMKKSVLEHMTTLCESYNPRNTKGIENVTYYDFFPVKIVDSNLLSEDFGFCHLATELGYDIYATATPKISHLGTFEFTGNLYDEYRLRYSNI